MRNMERYILVTPGKVTVRAEPSPVQEQEALREIWKVSFIQGLGSCLEGLKESQVDREGVTEVTGHAAQRTPLPSLSVWGP